MRTFSSFPLILCFTFVSKQANRPPAKLNLLTCQVKTNPEEKKCFDLISRKALSQTVQCLLYTFLENQPFEELVFRWVRQ